MSQAKVPPTTENPAVGTNPKESAYASHPSGRTTFDARGNAVWEWKTEDGQFSADINTQRLKKLEAPELSLEDTLKLSKQKDTKPAANTMPGGGFNPYDRGADIKDPRALTPKVPPKGNPLATKPAQQKQTAEPARKPIKDLRAYGEWLKMKQRLAEQKDDE